MASVRRLGELVGVLLRGVSQIFFLDNPWAGALLLVAVGWVHPWVALVVVTGALAQTVGAWALLGADAVRAGMMGYNGALVGAAAAAALGVPLPVYTWPFLLSLWLVMLVVAAVTRTRRAGGGTCRRTAPAPTR